MKDVRLEKVTLKNYDALIDLAVNDSQKTFVASNIYSLAEAYATTSDGKVAIPFGIYDGETPVGFLMIGYDMREGWDREVPDFAKNSYLVWRFMIDKQYQNRGYGRIAFQLALDYIRSLPYGRADCCWLSYEPENEVAKKLYASFGFVERPEYYVEGDEMPATLDL